MKIFGICVVKDEADIIAHTLNAARKWSDEIFVLDNGSTDDTWKIVQELAEEYAVIVPYKTDPRRFDNGIRAQVFNEFRHHATEGDWWCRLDADEIYVDSPRLLLERVKTCEVVWGLHLQYYFTDIDLQAWKDVPARYDASLPPHQRYRWYLADSSEARFFKHRDGLQWSGVAWPRHMGRICKERLLLRHYQYRSPAQIEQRLKTRLLARKQGCDSFRHIQTSEWRHLIRNVVDLNEDYGDGHFILDMSNIPKHRDGLLTRLVKQVMHGSGLWP